MVPGLNRAQRGQKIGYTRHYGRLVKWYHNGLQNRYCRFDSYIARSMKKQYLIALVVILAAAFFAGVAYMRQQEIVQNPLFYPIFFKKYLTTYNYDDQTYPKLLNTFHYYSLLQDHYYIITTSLLLDYYHITTTFSS